MKHFRVPAIVAALIFSSCVSSGGDAARLVPEDALAAVVVESPASLFRSAQSFFQAAGMDRFTEGLSLEKLFRDETEGKETIQEALKVLDYGRPVVLTVVPDPRGPEGSPNIVLWLPLKKDKSSFQRLREALSGFEGEACFVAGYAALGLKGPAPSALPKKTADFSRLSAYPVDSVKAWINVEALLRDSPDRLKSALKRILRPGGLPDLPEPGTEEAPDVPHNFNERHFDREEYERESSGAGLAAAGVLNVAVGATAILLKTAENIRTLDLALGIDERGLFLRVGAVPHADRALGKLAAAAGRARGIPYLKYLEADSLLGRAASFEPGSQGLLAKLYVQTLGLEELMGEKYFEILEASYAALGADSAFSLDITVDPEILRKAERAQNPGENSELLGRSLAFEASGAGSLRDREAFRSALRKLGEAGIFGENFQELLKSTGLILDLEVSEGSLEGIPYDSIRIDLGGEGLGADPVARAVVDDLLAKLTCHAGYAKDRYYIALGNPAQLPAAVRRDGAVRPLGGEASYRAFAADLPKETRGVYYLSLKKIFSLAAAFSKDTGGLPTEGLDRLYGYFAAAPGRLETGFFLGSGDIRALVGLVTEGRDKGPDIF